MTDTNQQIDELTRLLEENRGKLADLEAVLGDGAGQIGESSDFAAGFTVLTGRLHDTVKKLPTPHPLKDAETAVVTIEEDGLKEPIRDRTPGFYGRFLDLLLHLVGMAPSLSAYLHDPITCSRDVEVHLPAPHSPGKKGYTFQHTLSVKVLDSDPVALGPGTWGAGLLESWKRLLGKGTPDSTWDYVLRDEICSVEVVVGDFEEETSGEPLGRSMLAKKAEIAEDRQDIEDFIGGRSERLDGLQASTNTLRVVAKKLESQAEALLQPTGTLSAIETIKHELKDVLTTVEGLEKTTRDLQSRLEAAKKSLEGS